MSLTEFSVTFHFLESFELFDILDALLIWCSKMCDPFELLQKWYLLVTYELCILALYIVSLFLCSMDLLSFEFNGCCWLLWLCILFNISGTSFFNMGMNLSHPKCKGFYLYVIFIANMYSFVSYLLISSCTLLVLTWPVKLMSPTQLLNAVFTILQ